MSKEVIDLKTLTSQNVDDPEEDTLIITEIAAAQVIAFPDGGLHAWLSVFGGWLITFTTFGYSNSFGVFQSFYSNAGAGSPSQISWIGSLQLCLMFATGVISGKLFDEGYFHHILFLGSLLYIFSLFMLSIADPSKYYQLILAQGVGAGLGTGLLLVPAMSVQAHFWRKYRSFAMGIVMSGTSIGGIVFPILLNQLILNTSAGFAWGVRASAFLVTVLLVIANCIMTTRLPSAKERPPGPKPSIKAILTDVPYIATAGGTFLVLLGLFFPCKSERSLEDRVAHVVLASLLPASFRRAHGLSSNFSFYAIAILNAGSLVGRCIPNIFADRVGNFNMICPTSILCAALVFAMFGAKSEGAVIVFALLYGFFSGAFISLLPPTIAILAKSMDEVGIRLGLGYFLVSFAMLAGTPIDGALLNPGEDWARPVVFSGIIMFAGAPLLVLARQVVAHRRGIQRV